MSENDSLRSAWQAELTEDTRIEFEITSAGSVWGLAELGISKVDLWMKQGAGTVDLRIRVQRIDGDLSITVDRGDDAGAGSWWPATAAPRLLVRIGPDSIAEVEAVIGQTDESQASLEAGPAVRILGRKTLAE